MAAYVRGLLSNVQRKNVEALALDQGGAVRTLQRFLESIRWDEERLRDRCQRLMAAEHADPEALGVIDEPGTTKGGGAHGLCETSVQRYRSRVNATSCLISAGETAGSVTADRSIAI